MFDAKYLALLERGVIALERLANHFDPIETQRERQPAVLSTAIYDRDERERAKLRTTFGQQKPQPSRRAFETPEG